NDSARESFVDPRESRKLALLERSTRLEQEPSSDACALRSEGRRGPATAHEAIGVTRYDDPKTGSDDVRISGEIEPGDFALFAELPTHLPHEWGGDHW